VVVVRLTIVVVVVDVGGVVVAVVGVGVVEVVDVGGVVEVVDVGGVVEVVDVGGVVVVVGGSVVVAVVGIGVVLIVVGTWLVVKVAIVVVVVGVPAAKGFDTTSLGLARGVEGLAEAVGNTPSSVISIPRIKPKGINLLRIDTALFLRLIFIILLTSFGSIFIPMFGPNLKSGSTQEPEKNYY
jgi:hypothetical protein